MPKFKWQDRITGVTREDPTTLRPNPNNWRDHPKFQKKALSGSLEELGWIAPVIQNDTTGNIIDGHARLELAEERGEELVPVIHVDLTEDEEKLALLTFDPITNLATANRDILDTLIHEAHTDNPALELLIEQIAAQNHLLEQETQDEEPAPAQKKQKYFVVVECESPAEQEEIFTNIHELYENARVEVR
jgi:hypothetical protein